MTHTIKRTASSAGLMLALALLAFAMIGAGRVEAESPPAPPARFVGSVTVNGAPATAGTTIEAKVGSTTCGVTTVFISGSEARYSLDSPALDPAASPNCGTDGASVSFLVGGVQANETGTWLSYQLNTVNLTVSAAATPTPTTPTPGTPGVGTATPKPATPIAPVTGSGTMSSGGGINLAWFTIAAAVLGLASAGAAGLSVARRRQ